MLEIEQRTKDRLRVAEGVLGTFYYHLRLPEDRFGLCGDRVMHTSIPVSAWGTRTHVPERWCSRCEKAARELETTKK
jgi:hypothetical protein